jgi:hypothetical protein
MRTAFNRWREVRRLADRFGYPEGAVGLLHREIGAFGTEMVLTIALSENLNLIDAKTETFRRLEAVTAAAKQSGVTIDEAFAVLARLGAAIQAEQRPDSPVAYMPPVG